MTKGTKDKKLRLEITGHAMFARVHSPTKARTVNGQEYPSVYTTDLVVTNEKISKKLLELGVRKSMKTNEDGSTTAKEYKEYKGGPVFRISQRAEIAPGEEANPPFVRDSKGNPVSKTTLLGNGTKVKVTANLYDNPYKNCKQLGLVGLEILELVPYESTVETVDLTDGDTKGTFKSDILSLDDSTIDEVPFSDD